MRVGKKAMTGFLGLGGSQPLEHRKGTHCVLILQALPVLLFVLPVDLQLVKRLVDFLRRQPIQWGVNQDDS